MTDNYPKFSAGTVVGVVFAFWLVVYGSVVMYGMSEFQSIAVTTSSK